MWPNRTANDCVKTITATALFSTVGPTQFIQRMHFSTAIRILIKIVLRGLNNLTLRAFLWLTL